MKEFTIGKNESGQRLDKYLKKLLPGAKSSFLYKMLRKKNIVRNGKRADGSEKLLEGDVLRCYFSDETFSKFAQSSDLSFYRSLPKDRLDIIYEDEDILLINKPAGMLSQKARADDISANEYLIAYLLSGGKFEEADFAAFRPAVCNRLDRNTSGILTAGKTLKGLQDLSEMLKNRTVKKYYRCVVNGNMNEVDNIKGWLKKDEKTNQVTIFSEERPDSKYIETAYQPLRCENDRTLLEVHLITGRSHQIRAHLASIGHPIIGDMKYGNRDVNEKCRKQYGIRSQMLHAYRMEFPDGSICTAPLPEEFERIFDEIDR
jgi:23S rRNA pseudouridine955/2504/2580 synthase